MLPSHQRDRFHSCKDTNINTRCRDSNRHSPLCPTWIKRCACPLNGVSETGDKFPQDWSLLSLSRQPERIKGWCLWLQNKVLSPGDSKLVNWAMQRCSLGALENTPNRQAQTKQAYSVKSRDRVFRLTTYHYGWHDMPEQSIRIHFIRGPSKQFWSLTYYSMSHTPCFCS